MTYPLDPDQREARILMEKKGNAAYPRVDIEEELRREDLFWLDLRAHYTNISDWDLERFHYKERFFELLDSDGHTLTRVAVPLDGINGIDINTHLQFYLRRYGFPYETLRVRVRRRGGAYYGIKTFKASEERPPVEASPPTTAPVPAPQSSPTATHPPAPAPTPAPPAPSSASSGWEGILGALALAAAGISGYAILADLRAARERGARTGHRELLLQHRDEILTALAKRPYLYRGQEATQRLTRLTPDDQESDDLAWILKLWLEIKFEPMPHGA